MASVTLMSPTLRDQLWLPPGSLLSSYPTAQYVLVKFSNNFSISKLIMQNQNVRKTISTQKKLNHITYQDLGKFGLSTSRECVGCEFPPMCRNMTSDAFLVILTYPSSDFIRLSLNYLPKNLTSYLEIPDSLARMTI